MRATDPEIAQRKKILRKDGTGRAGMFETGLAQYILFTDAGRTHDDREVFETLVFMAILVVLLYLFWIDMRDHAHANACCDEPGSVHFI